MGGVQGDDGWFDTDEKPRCGIGFGTSRAVRYMYLKKIKIIQQESNMVA
jgi:hypothetical protein